MKILHVTDLHSYLPYYDWLDRAGRQYDLVVISGDLVDYDSRESEATNRRKIQDVAERLWQFPIPLALCTGNHDVVMDLDPDRRETGDWLQPLHRTDVWMDGDTFSCGGMTIRCIGWDRPLPRRGAPNEIWIVHNPPDKCDAALTGDGKDWGDYELGQICRAGLGPRLVLSGHIHQPRSWHSVVGRTLVLNPGCGPGVQAPNWISIDFTKGMASWREGEWPLSGTCLLP